MSRKAVKHDQDGYPLTGKAFEERIVYQIQLERRRGSISAGRYGVQVSARTDNGKLEWIPIKSLPDFEGILPPSGTQFIFEAKLCSQPSFALDGDKFQKRQKVHFYERSRCGAICFLLIHFTERHLKTRTDDALTVAFPISEDHPFWESVEAGEEKRITRYHAAEWGHEVPWIIPPRGRPRPNVLAAVLMVADTVTRDPALRE